jgi:hypothetical protein
MPEHENMTQKTDVAVNAYKVLTVPADRTWFLQSLFAKLISGAGAENRQVVIDIMDNKGTQQVTTATVTETAEGTLTAGSFNLTITCAQLPGTPLAVAVTVALNDSSVVVATKSVAALNASAAVAAVLVASQTSIAGVLQPTIVLTAKAPIANDATLNIAIPASLGLVVHATSVATTAGVAANIIWTRKFTSVQAASLTYTYYASGDVADAAVSVLTNFMKMNQMALPAGYFIRVWNNTAFTNLALDELDLFLLVDERTAGSRG